MVDIVLLVKPCSHHYSYHCADCRDFKLGPRLQRYRNTDQVRVIAFNDSQLLESEDIVLDLYNIFKGIENVILKVDCLVDEFRHAKKRRRDDLEQLFRHVRGRKRFEIPTNDVRITVMRSWDNLLDWRRGQVPVSISSQRRQQRTYGVERMRNNHLFQNYTMEDEMGC
jgi:hypothetical protein